MNDIAIRCEGLGKQYHIGEREHYRALRDTITNAMTAPFRRVRAAFNNSRVPQQQNGHHTFWALKDLSFYIKRGEVVGIIGRNGAGKSTLLKILSRITAPTTGEIEICGRVGSLLEVGTGFHPELTGRENIFLNGAILGMKKAEIKCKFDEIVAFAELEKFIDTPVKRYSSGMYVRLAFAVAAYMEPEILLVDEVLAVGDASFQRKCLNKMQDVQHEGRTIVFVSHNMHAVTRLCSRTILLDEGTIISDGPSHQVVSKYLTAGFGTSAKRIWPDIKKAPGNDITRLRSVRVLNDLGEVSDTIDIRRDVSVEVEYDVLQLGSVLVPNLHFFNEEGVCVFVLHEIEQTWHRRSRPVGNYVSSVRIPGNLLSEGTLIIGVAVSTHDPVIVHFYERDAVAFQVVDSLDGNSARGDYAGPMPGIVRPLLEWTISFKEQSNPISEEAIMTEEIVL
jgi:lipopolysaccharide transport system ATP-binding protein